MTNKRPQIIAVVAVALSVTSLFAQSAQLTGDALVRALLDEVCLLRLSMQKNSAYDLRGRLLLDRARMHHETIRELSREIEGASDFLNQPERVEWDVDSTMVEVAPAPGRGVVAAPDAEERRRLAEQQKLAMERRKAAEARHRETMRARLQRVENRIAEERAKLREIEDELAKMHRELTGEAR